MTVLAGSQPYEQYTGTGSRVYFEYGFEMLEDSTVFVVVDGIPVDFTQQENGVVLDVAPALFSVIYIYRITDITQLRDFEPFEAFHGDKTEFALDKLILLKQEAAIYRALCNLYADHQLSKVEIVNDKGSNADLFLWNEDKAGMFAGEVTEAMPAAGAVVEKPWDFAYFQYGFEETFTQQITSALFPIEIIEEIQLGAELTSAYMKDIDSESQSWSQDVVRSEIIPVKITFGPQTDEQSWSQGIVSSNIVALRINYGPDTDTQSWSQGIVTAEKLPGKVDAFTPDEELDIVAFLSTTDCYMVDA